MLVIAYDRTTRYADTAKTINRRRLAIEDYAREYNFKIDRFVTDKEPANLLGQHELHAVLNQMQDSPSGLILIAYSPYRLVKAGLNVLLPTLREIYRRVKWLQFVEPYVDDHQFNCEALEWAMSIRQEVIDERADTIRARRTITGRRGAGRPRLDIDMETLERYVKRHKSIRQAAKLMGISPETARLRLRELKER